MCQIFSNANYTEKKDTALALMFPWGIIDDKYLNMTISESNKHYEENERR